MKVNLNQNQTRNAGIVLLVLGIVFLFNLWWFVPAALLAGGGAFAYSRSRALGRRGEAVQGALWGFGLALLYLIGAIFPGILLLAGASLLLRGKEDAADARIQTALAQITRRRRATPSNQISNITVVSDEQPRTNETVRLKS